MTAPSPFEEAQAIRVLANAGLPEPTRQKAGLAFMKHMLQQGHDASTG